MQQNTTFNSTIQDVVSSEEDVAKLQDYILPVLQAIIFVVTVYVDKFVRKFFFGKKYKQLCRISTMTLLTLVLMYFNYQQKCKPHNISITECFYIKYDVMQCLHIIIMNTILFGAHIENVWTFNRFKKTKTFFRTAIMAPILQELLFRAVFYRSSSGRISIIFLSVIFSIAHLHKFFWKAARGKQVSLQGSLIQLCFTLIFALYSYYILSTFQSVIPCIVLHIYCNIIGPPQIYSTYQILKNMFCATLFFCYNRFYV